ncbi:hypothetical protein EBH_0081130 [Eimeria brunetti]|uniref:Uncharacterized protein n=1 Tax=Eimeria brunetti TaxID=51314 RepID=U6LNV7_9EIME|nr:hypothetical protein EBH_0081130 [Eimeria brunetti]
MLTADDVEDRIDEMENLVSLIGSAEKGDGKKGAGGRSLSSLVREAVKCYQKTVNGIVAPDVSTAQAEKFRALLQELEDILGRHIGKLRWVYTSKMIEIDVKTISSIHVLSGPQMS